MSLEIKHRKTAHIPKPVDMNAEFTEEIDDSRSAWWERIPQHEGCHNHRKDLLCEDDNFHSEELAELLVNLRKTNTAKLAL